MQKLITSNDIDGLYTDADYNIADGFITIDQKQDWTDFDGYYETYLADLNIHRPDGTIKSCHAVRISHSALVYFHHGETE